MKLHTSFPKGKRLMVGLRDGRRVVGKFLITDRKRKVMVLDVEGGRRAIHLRKIRFAAIYRGYP